MISCSGPGNDHTQINQNASLPASFNFKKLGLKVITSSVNKKQGTMSTLFGNEVALKSASSENQIKPAPNEMLALVTWKQQPDNHWFGAEIPNDISTLEILSTMNSKDHLSVVYEKFAGKFLERSADTTNEVLREKYMLSQRASIMP